MLKVENFKSPQHPIKAPFNGRLLSDVPAFLSVPRLLLQFALEFEPKLFPVRPYFILIVDVINQSQQLIIEIRGIFRDCITVRRTANFLMYLTRQPSQPMHQFGIDRFA